METIKIDDNSVEQTFKTIVFKVDLESEKETLEKRLIEVNSQLALLK